MYDLELLAQTSLLGGFKYPFGTCEVTFKEIIALCNDKTY
jgi:hypothetical protein